MRARANSPANPPGFDELALTSAGSLGDLTAGGTRESLQIPEEGTDDTLARLASQDRDLIGLDEDLEGIFFGEDGDDNFMQVGNQPVAEDRVDYHGVETVVYFADRNGIVRCLRCYIMVGFGVNFIPRIA